MWNVSEALIYIYATIYFRYIAKDWKVLFYISIFMASISILWVLFVVPESPKWLYGKKLYELCQENMLHMATVNGVKSKLRPDSPLMMIMEDIDRVITPIISKRGSQMKTSDLVEQNEKMSNVLGLSFSQTKSVRESRAGSTT
jgi:hypothetical protein